MRNTNIQLDLIGKPAPNHSKYYEQCKALSEENVRFLGQMERSAIIDHLKAAKVHILPSWFETTGLSSLEAGALGCNVVITAKGDTKEYFEDLAFYCDPESPLSIRKTIEKALSTDTKLALKEKIQKEFRWTITAQKTIEAYHRTLANNKD